MLTLHKSKIPLLSAKVCQSLLTDVEIEETTQHSRSLSMIMSTVTQLRSNNDSGSQDTSSSDQNRETRIKLSTVAKLSATARDHHPGWQPLKRKCNQSSSHHLLKQVSKQLQMSVLDG